MLRVNNLLVSSTAAEVIDRIVSFFEPVARNLMNRQLRDATRCVICQRLLPAADGGRIPAIKFFFHDTKSEQNGS